MKLWKCLLSPAMTLCLVIPGTVYAVDEDPDAMEDVTPSFQNAASAQRAANIADASFSEADQALAEEEATQEAKDQVDKVSSEYAEGVVKQVSSDYADRVVDEKATAYADGVVEEKAVDYATIQAELTGAGPGDRAYEAAYGEAYTYAIDRATGEGYVNAWDTAYKSAYDRATGEGYVNAWDTAYKSAYDRATNPDYHNAYDTAYDYANERATNPDYHNAYDTAYEKALAQEIAGITGEKIAEIHRLRYVERLGWGQIVKQEHINVHPSVNGLGHMKKLRKGQMPPEDGIAPRDPEAIPLDAEIAEATRRDTRTGWNDTAGFSAKNNNKNKNSKKTYGLTQTSGVATSDVQGNKAVNRGQSKKSNKSSYSAQTTTSTSSQSAQGGSPGIGSSSKSNGSNKGGNSSSNSNKGGNSSNNGNKGGKSSDKGNNGNNGNKGGNGKNK